MRVAYEELWLWRVQDVDKYRQISRFWNRGLQMYKHNKAIALCTWRICDNHCQRKSHCSVCYHVWCSVSRSSWLERIHTCFSDKKKKLDRTATNQDRNATNETASLQKSRIVKELVSLCRDAVSICGGAIMICGGSLKNCSPISW